MIIQYYEVWEQQMQKKPNITGRVCDKHLRSLRLLRNLDNLLHHKWENTSFHKNFMNPHLKKAKRNMYQQKIGTSNFYENYLSFS